MYKHSHTHVTWNLRKGLRNFLIRGANFAARVVRNECCAARSIADWRVPFSLIGRAPSFFLFFKPAPTDYNTVLVASPAACQARRYDASSFGNTGFFRCPNRHTHILNG